MSRIIQQQKQAAIAHIKRRPGISQDELAVAIGLPGRHSRTKKARNPLMKRLIEELVSSGAIWAARDEFAAEGDPLRCYPAGYKKPKLFRAVGDRSFTECKVYIDPAIAGSYKPAPKRNFTTQEEPEMKRNNAQIEQDVRAAIAYFQEQKRPFTQTNVRDRAGLNHEMLKARPALLEEINRAVAASQPRNAIEAHLQQYAAKATTEPRVTLIDVTEPETDRTAELEARVAELERQNRELQQQLAKQPQPTIGYLEGLKQEEVLCKATLKRIEDELQQLEADRKTALASLMLVRRLIALKTGEEEPIEFELVVSANGNGNGNGHRLEVSHA